MPEVNDSTPPAVYNPTIQFGETWARPLTITRNGSPENIQGWTFQLRIYKYDGTYIEIPVTIDDEAGGEVSWEMTRAVSATLPKGKYQIEMKVIDNDDKERNYFEGTFEVA